MLDNHSAVRTRHVLFIGGFDPKGASSFYQQHKAELERYSALSGIAHTITARHRIDTISHEWTTTAEQTTGKVTTVFEYLAWDDVVRELWARSPLELSRRGLSSLWSFIVTGSMLRLHKLAPATVRAALFPYALVLLALLTVIGISIFTHWLLLQTGYSRSLVIMGTALVTALTTMLVWRGLKGVPSTWFLRVVDFASTHAQGKSQTLEMRLDTWSNRICTLLAKTHADEVLVVGYSAGSGLAVSVLARVVRQVPNSQSARLNLLTLGNCVPVAAVQPSGLVVRAELATLGASSIPWLDYTSPIDWGAFPLNDPVTIFAPQMHGVEVLRRFVSPQFHLLFSPATYQLLKKNKYRVHQQYLQCPELIGTYDYFAMIYGTNTLRHRIAKL
jgi:hypothetical protein